MFFGNGGKMREEILAGFAAAVLLICIPMAAARNVGLSAAEETTQPAGESAPWTEEETAAETTQSPASAEAGFDETFSLPVLQDGKVVSMDLHTYLVGTLLAEMPTSFAPEALKAQAVACRTYTLRQYRSRKHGSAAVCTDSACCQGWKSPESWDPEGVEKAEQAVADTDGDVAVYDGALIDATFFSCSGGKTEAAVAVWGSDLPYLQSVESPGEEAAAHYEDSVSVSPESFCSTLQQADPQADFSGDMNQWVGQITYTEGNGVATAVLGGRVFTGVQLRRLFHLNSTQFTISVTDYITFCTKGFGHRVGMSQYGADAMARQGNTYVQILQWYYQGAKVKKLLRFTSEQLSFAES